MADRLEEVRNKPQLVLSSIWLLCRMRKRTISSTCSFCMAFPSPAVPSRQLQMVVSKQFQSEMHNCRWSRIATTTACTSSAGARSVSPRCKPA